MTDIIVLGAGMVGIGTALALQERGHSVIIIDRREPGEEASFGNAGMIQSEAVEPYALPLSPAALFKIAFGITNDVVWSPRHVAANIGSILRYARHSLPGTYHRTIVPVWAAMIARATADHEPLINATAAQELIRRDGYYKVYRTQKRFAEAQADAERTRHRFAVPHEIVEGATLADREPALRLKVAGAIRWTGSWSCSDPGALVKRYADLFRARGGSIVRGDATSLHHPGGGWQVRSSGGEIHAPICVLCLGAWTPSVARRFGHKFPMVFKVGYHRHFAVSNGPRLPLYDIERATFLSPMRQGLRVLTGAELAGINAAANLRQITRSEHAAGELFALGAPLEPVPWRGIRPCMPNMLPVIAPSSKVRGLWFNFGHGHQGFTLGPTTGRILAEALSASL